MEQHFIGKIAQKAIIVKDGKVLVTRKPGEEQWDFPGGRLNVDEDPVAGLEREIREEIGMEAVIDRPFSTGTFFKSGEWRFLINYLATLKDESGEMHLSPDEVQEVQWLGPDDFENTALVEDYKIALRKFFHEPKN